jgi:hypothetical protein
MLDPKQTETILLVFLFVCAPSALAGARRGLYRAVRVRERSSFDSRSHDFLANILAVESFFFSKPRRGVERVSKLKRPGCCTAVSQAGRKIDALIGAKKKQKQTILINIYSHFFGHEKMPSRCDGSWFRVSRNKKRKKGNVG